MYALTKPIESGLSWRAFDFPYIHGWGAAAINVLLYFWVAGMMIESFKIKRFDERMIFVSLFLCILVYPLYAVLPLASGYIGAAMVLLCWLSSISLLLHVVRRNDATKPVRS